MPRLWRRALHREWRRAAQQRWLSRKQHNARGCCVQPYP
jgi:hypothetical protein